MAHIIKKDRGSTRFFAAIFRVVAAVQFGRGVSIALPTLNEDHVTV